MKVLSGEMRRLSVLDGSLTFKEDPFGRKFLAKVGEFKLVKTKRRRRRRNKDVVWFLIVVE